MTLAPGVALARRSIVATSRQPQAIVPSLVFPLILCAINTAALGRATGIPGFPAVDSFLDFILATAIFQGVQIGALSGGTDLARDIEGGFLDRLLTSPASAASILVGRLAGTAVLGGAQAVIFMVVLGSFGARIASGPVGVLGLVVLAMLLALTIGGFTAVIALRSGSAEAVQGFFPVFFAFLFFSSAFFPRTLMTGWFRTVADYNPVSHLIESMRGLVISDFDPGRLLLTMLGVCAAATVTIGLAGLALRARARA